MTGRREIGIEVMPGRSARGKRPGFSLLLVLVALAWGVELADRLLPVLDLDRFGIRPREIRGLPGVLLSPWLHGGWEHLLANTLGFLGLAAIVLVAEGRRFASTTLILVVISGLGTWLIGRPAVHIGASGLIYGYFGYVLGRAIWEGRLTWILVGLAVAALYGWMIFGVLPTRGLVSWEGHLAGLLAGLWLGRRHAGNRRR